MNERTNETGKKKGKRRRGLSTATGMYFPCPVAAMVHRHPQPTRTASAIMQGPERAFVRCGVSGCGCTVFFPRAWQNNYGLTPTQAAAAGYVCL